MVVAPWDPGASLPLAAFCRPSSHSVPQGLSFPKEALSPADSHHEDCQGKVAGSLCMGAVFCLYDCCHQLRKNSLLVKRSFGGGQQLYFFNDKYQGPREMYHRSSNLVVSLKTLCQGSWGSGLPLCRCGCGGASFPGAPSPVVGGSGKGTVDAVLSVAGYFHGPAASVQGRSLKEEYDTVLELVPQN